MNTFKMFAIMSFSLLRFFYIFLLCTLHRLQPHASDVCEQELYDLMRISKLRRGDKKRNKRVHHFEASIDTYFTETPPLSISTPGYTIESVVREIRAIEEREGLVPLSQKKMVQIVDLWPARTNVSVGEEKEREMNIELLLVSILGEESDHIMPLLNFQRSVCALNTAPVESKECEDDGI